MKRGTVSNGLIPSHLQRSVHDFRRHFVAPALKPKPVHSTKIKGRVNDENTNYSNFEEGKEKEDKAGLTKRIKKTQGVKRFAEDRMTETERRESSPVLEITDETEIEDEHYIVRIQDKRFRCYPQSLLRIPEPFANLNLPHKQDNDCDSDWEQVQAGAHKLYKQLKQAIMDHRSI